MGVANNGILTAIAKGKTLVVAADTKNTAHFDETEVSITNIVLLYTCTCGCGLHTNTKLQYKIQYKFTWFC